MRGSLQQLAQLDWYRCGGDMKAAYKILAVLIACALAGFAAAFYAGSVSSAPAPSTVGSPPPDLPGGGRLLRKRLGKPSVGLVPSGAAASRGRSAHARHQGEPAGNARPREDAPREWVLCPFVRFPGAWRKPRPVPHLRLSGVLATQGRLSTSCGKGCPASALA